MTKTEYQKYEPMHFVEESVTEESSLDINAVLMLLDQFLETETTETENG